MSKIEIKKSLICCDYCNAEEDIRASRNGWVEIKMFMGPRGENLSTYFDMCPTCATSKGLKPLK